MHTEYLQVKGRMLGFCVKILRGKEREKRRKELSLGGEGIDETRLAEWWLLKLPNGTWRFIIFTLYFCVFFQIQINFFQGQALDKEVSFLWETKSQNKNQIPKLKKTLPGWQWVGDITQMSPVDLSLHKMRGRDQTDQESDLRTPSLWAGLAHLKER